MYTETLRNISNEILLLLRHYRWQKVQKMNFFPAYDGAIEFQ